MTKGVKNAQILFLFMKKMPFQKLAWHTRLSFINALLLQECKSITKRAAVRGDPTQGLLSYGPIRIDIPDRPQSSKDLCFVIYVRLKYIFLPAQMSLPLLTLLPAFFFLMIVT